MFKMPKSEWSQETKDRIEYRKEWRKQMLKDRNNQRRERADMLRAENDSRRLNLRWDDGIPLVPPQFRQSISEPSKPSISKMR
jgi:hypothetical protein